MTQHCECTYTMKKAISDKIRTRHPLDGEDAARLILEFTEELGERAAGLGRMELMQLLRRAVRTGVKVMEQEEHTVSFAEAARASAEARSGRRETTVRDLRNFVQRMLRVEGVGERPLRSMSTRECRELLQRAFCNSVHSYRKGRAILHSIFEYGIRREWCDKNPVKKIDPPAVTEKEIRPLSLQEVQRLESTATRPEYRDMLLPLQLMLYCGVRPGEITRLRPEDIRWQEGELIIRPNTSKTGGGRVIPLRHIHKQKSSSRIAPKKWSQRWRALRQAAGFRHWQADALRHTFASYHAAYFRNLPALQLEMGHRDSTMLRSRYMSPVSRKDAAAFWKTASIKTRSACSRTAILHAGPCSL